MKRSQLLVYLALVFAAGIGVGALGHRFAAVSSVGATPPPPRTPEEFRRDYTREMTQRLSLSPDQVTRLSAILDDTGARMHALREKMRPETKLIQDDQVNRINQILSSTQQAEYAKMRKERDDRRRRQDEERKRIQDEERKKDLGKS